MPILPDPIRRPPEPAAPLPAPSSAPGASSPPPPDALRPVADGFDAEASGAAQTRQVVLQRDPSKMSLTRQEIAVLTQAVGRRLTAGELADLFPNALLDGRGAALAELAAAQVRGLDGPKSLADAPVDRNGDLDVTELLRADVKAQNPNLILRKDDELPVPLEYTLAHGTLVVRDPPSVNALTAEEGRADATGAVRINLADMDRVRAALVLLGLHPEDAVMREHELAKAGVRVPLSADDQLRRILVGRVDAPVNELDIHDKTVLEGAAHNHELTPTVYASAKVSPAHADEVILTYKRFNNQSFVGQGNWVARLFRKDERPQHEFDGEATFVKLDAATGERMAVLAARHFYGELATQPQLAALAERTGRTDLTTSVSPKAHGARLAERGEVRPWAGDGIDGVTAREPKDHVLKDLFLGFDDTRPGGRAIFIPKERINLILESDDLQTLNLQTQFGETRHGLFGSGVLDKFNDGGPVDRFGGTDWYYAQEAIQSRRL